MFLSKTRLPHLLAPRDYFCVEQYQRERERLLVPGWHVVGTTDELRSHGDFITRNLFGHPIQVRNFDGQLRAMSNVCAHRHCLLTNQSRGNSPRMSCQYHGWEYGPDGKTRKIPQPKNFTPYPEQGDRIAVHRVETCGQIVFVSIADDGPGLQDFLGEYFEVIQLRFGEQTKQFLNADVEYQANWKVPIENSLEAYHVPSVHAGTFRDDPGEHRSTHIINELSSAFGTPLPFSPHSRLDKFVQRGEATVMRMLGAPVSNEYWQHHVFPNLMMSITDAISLIHYVIPTGPTSSMAVIRQFGNLGTTRHGPRRWLGNFWGGFKGAVTRSIMKEDLGIIPDIQAGLQSSQQAGVLGRCEERIHAFQQYVVARTKVDDR
ncbi:aromatic ring-hydroxylating oxygenase subunit alpha [Aporhodopirellula aestuarii]|uniref:Aromatic ring-hydroxylating dioxygenase subunit alpha n=1 Tax=Aporhodopirellula aestuarii TaxID=2950107 RepID=A0ABT0UF65_9BACT|nr:aromatic ring-hydroxylating dioxygenase subunit alpha [Aporhodopirellula aestuarii]MCM2374918.1 aromatic ring-hydroxylating dioxygenase subunit alpha [Aporhodopirellula aestuarii]